MTNYIPRQIYRTLIMFVCIAAISPHDIAKASSIEERFANFYRIQSSMPYDTTSNTTALITSKYQKRFSREQAPRKLRLTTNKELELLYRAASIVTFYRDDSVYIHDMKIDIDELQRRGLTTQREYDDLFTSFVSARMFHEAHVLAAMHPSSGMGFLPTFRDQSRGGPTALILSNDMRLLIRRSVDMRKSAQVIAVSSPWCHFCQRAVRDIENDPALRRVFKDHVLWLALPDGSIPFSAIHKWNVQNPHENMAITYRIQEWPMFDHWDTPTFYFFKKHVLISKLVGWPREGQTDRLKRALRRVDLL